MLCHKNGFPKSHKLDISVESKSQQAFTCSKSTIEIPDRCAKSVQS